MSDMNELMDKKIDDADIAKATRIIYAVSADIGEDSEEVEEVRDIYSEKLDNLVHNATRMREQWEKMRKENKSEA